MTRQRGPAPAWAYEPIHVVQPDPGWLALAERFINELHSLLGSRLVDEVMHVGSTAVPGLMAKPIIDLQAVAPDPGQVVADCLDDLSPMHWHFVLRELDQRPWRWFVVRSDDLEQHRLAHLHIMSVGEPRWHQQLAFRNRLRESEELVRGYAALKAGAAAVHRDDREAYTGAKDDFVQRVVTAR